MIKYLKLLVTATPGLSTTNNYILSVIIPILLALVYGWFTSTVYALYGLVYFSIFFITIHFLFVLSSRLVRHWVITLIFITLAAFNNLYVFVAYAYRIGSNVPFDMFYLADNISAAIPTLNRVFGVDYVVIILSATFAIFILNFFLWRASLPFAYYHLGSFSSTRLFFITGLFIFVVAIAPPIYGSTPLQTKNLFNMWTRRAESKPYIPSNKLVKQPTRDENIIFLHLESLNGLTATGRGNPEHPEPPFPQLSAIAQDGTWLVNFFASSIQTNRVVESVLCGIANNLGVAYSYPARLDQLPSNCLPAVLARQGYQTLYFSAFPDSRFMNFENFIPKLGFTHSRYADYMNAQTDSLEDWGWDDCDFYTKTFQILNQEYPSSQPKFVYMEVGSSHYPFINHQKYRDIHRYPRPQTFVENYTNSLLEQDACLGKFYQYYRESFADSTHLFIYGDNSWPIGLHDNNFLISQYAFNDNFIVPLVYIPPRSREKEFAVNKQDENYYGQSDIAATVVELLGGQLEDSNSFLYTLLANPDFPNQYQNCHVLVQPYTGGYIAVINGQSKYIYHLETGQLTLYDLKQDFYEQHPLVLEDNLSYNQFTSNYLCDRYK